MSQSRRIRRFARVAVAGICAVTLLSAGSGAAFAAQSNAATVAGMSISDASFRKELKALTDNKVLGKQLEQSAGPNASPRSISTEVAAQWLSALLQQRLIDRDVRRKKIKITKAIRKEAVAFSAQQFGSEAAFKAFPKWFRELELRRFERLLALVGPAPTERALRKDFAKLKESACPSGKSLGHVLVNTRAEADAIVTELAAGGDFATIARERSTDKGSGAQGGLLGCYVPGSFVAAFEAAGAALKVGATSEPVQTEYGWHVIRANAVTFESLRSQIEGNARQTQFANVAARINKELKAGKAWVNPRYGKVQFKPEFAVVPPKAPAVKERPASTTTAPPAGIPLSPGAP